MEAFIQDTARKAGAAIMELFGKSSVLYSKNDNAIDIVTEADLAANKIITDAIKSAYPDHGIISEEGQTEALSLEYVWCVDPLDGTKNFASNTPLFGVSMALMQNGEVIHAGIYAPVTDDFYYAEKGKGAFQNGQKVSCSKKDNWDESFGIGPIRLRSKNIKFMSLCYDLMGDGAWINCIGMTALAGAWVASGKRDWYMSAGQDMWGQAATCLLAKEAGCRVTNFAGGEYKPGDKGIVMANEFMHPGLLTAVQKAYDLPIV